MLKLMMFVGKLWLLVAQWKYFWVARKAAQSTVSCGYDAATVQQRINEAMGLAMVNEWLIYELAVLKAQGGWKTEWQEAKIVTMCTRANGLLRGAGWDTARIMRTCDKITEKASQ